jgi:di/tricarboxylate transporter
METEAREKEREEVEDVGGRKTYRSAIAASADVDPTIPALAAIFGANYGFMLPVSTRMLKAGAVFDIIGIVLCVIGVVAMANLVGLA